MTWLYYLGVALLFTHELDAVRFAEWQLLFGLRGLEPTLAATVFIALHAPLFVLFLWLGHHGNPRVQGPFRLLAMGFLVVHGALHWQLSGTPAYLFEGGLSALLIFAAAVTGVLYLLLAGQARIATNKERQ